MNCGQVNEFQECLTPTAGGQSLWNRWSRFTHDTALEITWAAVLSNPHVILCTFTSHFSFQVMLIQAYSRWMRLPFAILNGDQENPSASSYGKTGTFHLDTKTLKALLPCSSFSFLPCITASDFITSKREFSKELPRLKLVLMEVTTIYLANTRFNFRHWPSIVSCSIRKIFLSVSHFSLLGTDDVHKYKFFRIETLWYNYSSTKYGNSLRLSSR